VFGILCLVILAGQTALPASCHTLKTKPKMIVVGKSLFLFPEPVAELSEVCRQYKTRIMYEAAHVLGLIAGKRFQRR
jgi:glycine/serine hydroxymethyltransferase